MLSLYSCTPGPERHIGMFTGSLHENDSCIIIVR